MKQGGWRKRASDRDGWGTWGGYMSAKVQKLENQFHSEAALQHQKDENSSSIFSGVAIFVNGFTDPSADELRRLMMLHGGQYHVYYSRSKTTHIIATNLPNAKIKELKGEKVVRPDWIIDSIKAGRLLSYIPYQLYTKQTSIQKGLWFNTICKPEDSVPGPSNISVGLNRVNSLVKKHEVENEMKTNGMSKSKKEAETTRFLEQALSRSKQNGIHQKDNFSTFNGHSHSSNSALKMQDGLLHFDKSVVSRLSPLHEEVKESTDFRDCSTQQLQQSNRNTELLRNVHRTMSHSSFSSLHSNIKINGAHHYTVQGPSSTKSTISVPDPNKEDYSPLCKPSNGNFISDFYSHSRLHHISTWKCEFTEFINTLQKQNNASFPGREKLKKNKAGQSIINKADLDSTFFLNSAKHQCCIMHVDMDCFFVSVGIRDKPDLKGKPVAVTSNRGSGKALLRPGANPQLERQYYLNKLLKGRTDLVLASDFSIRCSTFTMCLSSFPTFDERFSTLPSSEKNVSSIAPELHEVTSSA